MNKNIIITTFSIIIFSVVILTAINFHNNDVLESRINTIAKYGKVDSDSSKADKSFKEDYYILQQSHDTNLILVVFGLVVAIMGLFTYQNLTQRFENRTNEMLATFETYKSEIISDVTNEVTALRNEWEITIEKFHILENNIYTIGAQSAKEISQFYLAKGDLSAYLLYSLAAASHTVSYYSKLRKDTTDGSNSSEMPSNFDLFIEQISANIGESLSMPKVRLIVIENYIVDIRKINHQGINRTLSEIHAKLKEIKPTTN